MCVCAACTCTDLPVVSDTVLIGRAARPGVSNTKMGTAVHTGRRSFRTAEVPRRLETLKGLDVGQILVFTGTARNTEVRYEEEIDLTLSTAAEHTYRRHIRSHRWGGRRSAIWLRNFEGAYLFSDTHFKNFQYNFAHFSGS